MSALPDRWRSYRPPVPCRIDRRCFSPDQANSNLPFLLEDRDAADCCRGGANRRSEVPFGMQFPATSQGLGSSQRVLRR